jgi:integration host factor subunit beta
MTKTELIKLLAMAEGISVQAAETAVNVIFDTMRQSLLQGDRIEIRGLGSFNVKNYGAYVGRNPMSKGVVEVKPKRLPLFRMGKELKARMNGKT